MASFTSSCTAYLPRKGLHRSRGFLLFAGTVVAYLWYQNWTHLRRRKKEKEKSRLLGSNRVLHTDIVEHIVATQYDVGGKPIRCELIRAGFNHNYVVEMADKKKYVLRVYLNDKYYIQTADDFRFELDLIDYLATEHNIPVARPLATKAGDWLSEIHFGEEEDDNDDNPLSTISKQASIFKRYSALFEFAPGVEVQSNVKLTPKHFQLIGKLQAQIHQAADQFTNPHQRHRYHQDVSTYLLDKSLAIVGQELVKHDPSKSNALAFFQPTAQAIKDKIQRELPTKDKPYYGLIHGDLHSGNLFWDETTQSFTVIDWDHCSYGWRVYDSASMVHPSKLAFFLEGYESIRALSPGEKELIPLFRMLRDIWDMGDILAFLPLWGEDDDMHREVGKQQRLQGYVDRLHSIAQRFRETYPGAEAEGASS